MSTFTNKVVWLTGASSGIGEQLVYLLAKEGARLIISSRREEELSRVKMVAGRDDILILPLDLSDSGLVAVKASKVLEEFKKIDFLIHNAGVACRDFAINTSINIDRRIMDANYFGAVVLTKEVLPSMVANKSGHLVVVSSLSGKYGVPQLSSYAASKHALHGFFDSLRAEVAPDNIKVSIVIPGFVKTAITVNALKGDGSSYGKMVKANETGITAETCARKILKAVAKGKEEALIGGFEITSVYFRRFFPAIFSKVIRDSPVKRWRKLVRIFSKK